MRACRLYISIYNCVVMIHSTAPVIILLMICFCSRRVRPPSTSLWTQHTLPRTALWLLVLCFVDGRVSDPSHCLPSPPAQVENWKTLADQLEGMSGRQISKLCEGWQAAAYASNDNVLTKELMERAYNTVVVRPPPQKKKNEFPFLSSHAMSRVLRLCVYYVYIMCILFG